MNKKIVGIFVITLLIVTTSATLLIDISRADWDPDVDGYKMHYPQTPDTDYLDVHSTINANTELAGWVADDWTCSGTGYVTEIHFWGSWCNDQIGDIERFNISIRRWDWGGDPVGPVLWARDFYPSDFVRAGPYPCDCMWLNPYDINEYITGDIEELYYLYNIENIREPFFQNEGYSYWLCIGAYVVDPATCWGWKVTDTPIHGLGARCMTDTWDISQIIDQQEYIHDMAFVINGEPLANLDVKGSLSWSNQTPGDTIISYLEISNTGDNNSNLNWEVSEYPKWGTWSFTPDNGTNLKPEDGPVEVEVEVEFPDEKEAEFDGEVKIINLDNPENIEMIPVTLTTPKTKVINIPLFLQRFFQLFPIFEKILNQLV